MKDRAPERLAKAIVGLENRIYNHYKKNEESALKVGACLVNPKRAFVKKPTSEVQEQLEQIGKDYFKPLGADGFYFQYFTPPMLPIVEGVDANTPATVDDYQVTLGLPEFDARWELQFATRAFLYCPGDDAEMSCWQSWFDPQLEAIRLTPLLFHQLREHEILGQIRLILMGSSAQTFDFFVRNYARSDFHLKISDKERKQIDSIDLRLLYSEIKGLFNQNNLTLYGIYKKASEKAAKSRNSKIKALLRAFSEYVEDTLINKPELSENVKKQLLSDLRGLNLKGTKKKYRAKRPVICLSDVECAQYLYLCIREFISSPVKNQVYGEIALYIWICQHAAFSNLSIKVEEVLKITVKDINFEDLTININGKIADLTFGLAEVTAAWIGPNERQNKRKLLPTLNYDTLEKKLIKISKKMNAIENRLQPRDFLGKVHVLAGAQISVELRKQFDDQAILVKSSPYRIYSRKIKKHLFAAFNKKSA